MATPQQIADAALEAADDLRRDGMFAAGFLRGAADMAEGIAARPHGAAHGGQLAQLRRQIAAAQRHADAMEAVVHPLAARAPAAAPIPDDGARRARAALNRAVGALEHYERRTFPAGDRVRRAQLEEALAAAVEAMTALVRARFGAALLDPAAAAQASDRVLAALDAAGDGAA